MLLPVIVNPTFSSTVHVIPLQIPDVPPPIRFSEPTRAMPSWSFRLIVMS